MSGIQEQIEALRAWGIEVCVATPPACQEVWQRAKQDGRFHLGHLYLVNQALDEGAQGAVENASHDIWILYDETHPDEALRTLLHELCHAKRLIEEPQTLDRYWEEEAAVIWEAFELAQEWGLPNLFSGYSLLRDVRRAKEQQTSETLAAEVVGSTWPGHAKAAYRTIEEIGLHHQWDNDTFALALRDRHPNASINAAFADLDRTSLRPVWLPLAVGGTFGRRDTVPQDARSARLLRATLRAMARRDGPAHWLAYDRGPERFCVVYHLRAGQGLAPLLQAVQDALLSHPERPAEVTWSLYSNDQDASERLYHLSVVYWDQPETHVWARASREQIGPCLAEAAWQRYVLSWLTQTKLTLAGSLEQGYARLRTHSRRKRRYPPGAMNGSDSVGTAA